MKIFKILLSLPKSVWFNFSVLPFKQAIKLPIFISYNTKVKLGVNYKVLISSEFPVSRGMIRFGINNGSFELGKSRSSFLNIENNAKLIFKGRCDVDSGFHVAICNSAYLEFGNRFHANAGLLLSSSQSIKLCNHVGFGWNCTLIDGDGHKVLSLVNNEVLNSSKEITIGDNCWLSANVTILKGVELSPNVIVPFGSIITKSCLKSYCIFGGFPNKIIREDVTREDKINFNGK